MVDELNAGRSVYGGSDEMYNAPWMETVEDPPEMVLRKELGAGETAVIALAVKIGTDLVVLDDLAARNVAAGLGLNVTGTLGILMAAHTKGILSDLHRVVDDLQHSGFRLSDAIVQSILKFTG